MFKELDVEALTVDIEEKGLSAGDAGVMDDVYTIALVAVLPPQDSHRTSEGITHTRSVNVVMCVGSIK